MVWLTSTDASRPIETDVDELLDCLGMPRDIAPGGANRWWAIDVEVAACRSLSIPTAIDALPPFRPASPGSACGATLSLGTTSLPEVIARPADLPDGQWARPVGASTRARALDDVL